MEQLLEHSYNSDQDDNYSEEQEDELDWKYEFDGPISK